MKTVLFALALALTLTACTATIPNTQDTNEPIKEPSSSHDTSELIGENSNSQEIETDEVEESATKAGIEEAELFMKVLNETILAYQNGTIEVNDSFGALPSDFIFPEHLVANDIDIQYREVMGDYRIRVTSVNRKWDMVLFVNDFVYNSADGATGGEPTVTGVVFEEAY